MWRKIKQLESIIFIISYKNWYLFFIKNIKGRVESIRQVTVDTFSLPTIIVLNMFTITFYISEHNSYIKIYEMEFVLHFKCISFNKKIDIESYNFPASMLK